MRERNLGSMTASVGLGVVLLLAVACTSSSSSAASTSSTTTTTPPPATQTSQSPSGGGGGTATVTGKTSLAMTAENFSFSPSELVGSPGQTLKITVKNTATVPHNFSIDAQNINVTINPGQSKVITVTFPQSGSVQFYCLFHKVSNNMVGELKVG
ncbi:MAG TPA: cupredoxin domain-containing protein [Actinomycetota bacterium]|nr:cupredoxin domain-containing protein [Actinomycetota bacterium]